MTNDDVLDLAGKLAPLGVKRVCVEGERLELEFFERMAPLEESKGDRVGDAMEESPPMDPFADPALFPGRKRPSFGRRPRAQAAPAPDGNDGEDNDLAGWAKD